MKTVRLLLPVGLCLALAACAGTTPKQTPAATTTVGHAPVAHGRKPVDATPADGIAPTPRRASPYAPAQEDASKRGDYVAGGLYAPTVKDTVPDHIPDVDAIPEPVVQAEPRARTGNRSYSVLGRRYQVLDRPDGYVEKGGASYYGNKFHGRRTSSGEVYDMYAFTAAHRSLPLPSFVRVTNLDNGKSVVVRVNDRGPFHDDRIIDLSYAAAVKLGYRERGTARVKVEALTPHALDADQTASTVSAIDKVVQALPQAVAQAEAAPAAPARPVSAAQADRGQRYDLRKDGKPMTAEEFDAWVRSRQVRVATGMPGVPDPAPPAAAAVTQPPLAPLTAAAQAAASFPDAGAMTFQVGSFANRENAEHALGLLQRAGVAGARLLDAASNGKPLWRLRIGPVQAALAPELAARVAGLGFGTLTRVRE